MAASILYSGAFDLAVYGASSIDWTDASGPHIVSLSTGVYAHAGSNILTGYGATPFMTALVAAMDAATAQTVTGGFDEGTGLATLTCTGATFSISFAGAAGTRMKDLLGFYMATTGALTYTGSLHPVYVIKPRLQAVTAYKPPFRESGRSITKRTSDGTMYSLKPTAIVRMSSWRHDFEPKGMIDRAYFNAIPDTATAKNNYTWEDLWDTFGEHILPIFAIWYSSNSTGEREYLCFDLMVDDFEESTHGRMNPRDDVRFKVMISASIRGRSIQI